MVRVLVVDDDADVRELVAGWLRVDGHQVIDVGSAALALDSVDDGWPQVAVVDVLMPDMDGLDLLARLRQRDGGLPAVALTVLWSGPDVARIRAAGATYLPKPSSGAQLRLVVRELVTDAEPTGSRDR
ncbi:response regulator [Actinokineospora enzanensis]|uniref:response regulator n=1 Tax=Actinokineospora enzanensis TaxID=155975 RepID=UPI0003669F71|nr:response regulator [Actinokineospora enzanensis]